MATRSAIDQICFARLCGRNIALASCGSRGPLARRARPLLVLAHVRGPGASRPSARAAYPSAQSAAKLTHGRVGGSPPRPPFSPTPRQAPARASSRCSSPSVRSRAGLPSARPTIHRYGPGRARGPHISGLVCGPVRAPGRSAGRLHPNLSRIVRIARAHGPTRPPSA